MQFFQLLQTTLSCVHSLLCFLFQKALIYFSCTILFTTSLYCSHHMPAHHTHSLRPSQIFRCSFFTKLFFSYLFSISTYIVCKILNVLEHTPHTHPPNYQVTHLLTNKHTNPPTYSPIHPPAHQFTHPLTNKHTDPPTYSPIHPPAHQFTHPPTNPPIHSPTHPPTDSLTNPPIHPPTHQLTHQFTHLPTHPPIHPPTHQFTHQPTNSLTYPPTHQFTH